ncbi:hypothetical protein QBC39DRAFT_181433 [Podospora conica]|nr:hypothetical protein QBC39DRAFT_181433 [Schizothecium conicum]
MTSTPPAVAEFKAAHLLDTFERITDQIFVQPSPPNTPLDPSHPTTVVIYGWGDALPKHLAKYVSGYRALFPASRLVLIFSPILRALLAGLDARTQTMAPVLDAIYGPAGTAAAPDRVRILIQVMSNTGGINYAATLNAHAARHAGAALPHALLVLDSTPGSTDFFPNIGRWSRALALGAGKIPIIPFAVTQAVAAGFLGALSLAGWLAGRTSAADFSVGAVNNPALCDVGVRRVYLYSKADDIIHWEDIEKHMAAGREKGYVVEGELFEGTPHVGHMRAWPEEYWGTIERCWGEVVKKEKA